MRREMLPGIVIALIIAAAFAYGALQDDGDAAQSADNGGEIIVPVLDGHIVRFPGPPEAEPTVPGRPTPTAAPEPIPEPRPPMPAPRPVAPPRPFMPRP